MTVSYTHLDVYKRQNNGSMDTPPTGDSKTIIYIWGTIMLFAAGILVGFTVLAVKKKNRS